MLLFAVLLFAVLLAGPAHAHRPHSVVEALALSPDFATSGRAWMAMNPHDVSEILRSDDHTHHWDFVGGPPMDDIIVAAAYSGASLVLLGQDGRIWTSPDEAATWSSAYLPASVQARDLAVSGTGALVATDRGVFTGQLSDPGAMTALQDARAFRHVAFSPTDAGVYVAVADDGSVWRHTDSAASLARIKDLPGPVTAWDAVQVHGRLVAATSDDLFRYDEGSQAWRDCGVLPVHSTASYAHDVVRLHATSQGRLLAATGQEAVFLSTDDCDTWQLLDTGVTPVYGGIGNATSPDQGFVALEQVGDTLVVAGFMGLSVSDDRGATWTFTHLLPADYCRGVAFSPAFPADPRIWVGGYGGGAWWTTDGGLSWAGSAVGLDGVYAYDLQPARDVASSHRVYYSGSDQPYASDDDGMSWRRFELPMERVRTFRDLVHRLYAMGEDATGGIAGQLAWSQDAGASWQEFDALYDLMQGSDTRDAQEATIAGQDWLLVVADKPAGLLGSSDDGASWTWLYQGDPETAAGGAAWPPGDSSRLVFASPTPGVLLSDDMGGTWRSPAVPPQGRPRILVQADDGTLLLSARDGVVWRSGDGGDTWAAGTTAIAPAVFDLVTAPGFASSGIALAGTQAGVYWTADRGDTWQPLPRYERFEARSVQVSCAAASGGDCATYRDSSAGFGGGWELAAGDVLGFTFQGHDFHVIGPSEGTVGLELNGQDQGTLSTDPDGLWVGGLGSDWKDVAIQVQDPGSQPWRVDVVELWSDGEPLSLPAGTADTADTAVTDTSPPHTADTAVTDTARDDSGDTGEIECNPVRSCGCRPSSGRACAILLLPLGLLPWRRRFRRPGPRGPTTS